MPTLNDGGAPSAVATVAATRSPSGGGTMENGDTKTRWDNELREAVVRGT